MITRFDLSAAADTMADVVVVEPRVLRRLVARHHLRRWIAVDVPHADCLAIPREAAERHFIAGDVGTIPDVDPLVVVAPAEIDLSSWTLDEGLTWLWRKVFHARLDAAIAELLRTSWTDLILAAAIDDIGWAEFDEIRYVLRHERLLLPPPDGIARRAATFGEFVATWHELDTFAPIVADRWFPGLRERGIARLCPDGLEPAPLLARSKPIGAPESNGRPTMVLDSTVEEGEVVPLAPPLSPVSLAESLHLLASAEAMASTGRYAAAAVEATRASAVEHADADLAIAAREQASDHLLSLARQAPELGAVGPEQWHEALLPVLEPAAVGLFPRERRLLSDLEKASRDARGEVCRVDLVRWVRSLGREPLLRPLPGLRTVRVARRLKSVLGHGRAARVSAAQHGRLIGVLEAAASGAEAIVRQRFGPRLSQMLVEVGLTADNPPEEVAQNKLVAELNDRIADKGHLLMGDLRDAISRSDLRLPDATGVREVLAGDAVLRANRRLAVALDDVYRPGDFYLRILQATSSAVFGSPVGRFLTRFAGLPLLGAYTVLEGLQHLINPVLGWVSGPEVDLATWPSVIALAIVILAIIYVDVLQRALVSAGHAIASFARVARERLVRAWQHPTVQRVVRSRWVRWLVRHAMIPSLAAGFAGVAAAWLAPRPAAALTAAGVVFVVANALIAVPYVRVIEERALDIAVRGVTTVWGTILPGAWRWFSEIGRRSTDGLERVTYAAQDALRFRGSDRQGSAGLPGLGWWVIATFGLVWSMLAYLVRIYVTLLVEPQVNPIKHFPVVTVAHKIMLPFSVQLTSLLTTLLSPLGKVLGGTIAATTVFLSPGVFGFLVWELKENWRLYAANRPARIEPVVIGSHGETLRRLLRVGFHSGTLPKLYKKLRRAERRALWSAIDGGAQKLRSEIHHVEVVLERFFHRELVVLLARGADVTASIDKVRCTSNRVRVDLMLEQHRFQLRLEEHEGLLVAGLQQMDAEPLDVALADDFERVLAGTYAKLGVELVREQLRRCLPAGVRYHLQGHTCVVWTESGEVEFDLDEPHLAWSSIGGTDAERRTWAFRLQPISWDDWVTSWRQRAPLPGIGPLLRRPPSGQ